MRVLPLSSIPDDLWDGSVLSLPESHTTSYEAELVDRGLLKHARNAANAKGVHGGSSVAETLEHFSARFVTSSGRVGYSVLGPDRGFDEVSDAFLATFSDGDVTLLDIPCGSGPSSLTLLATLVSLRRHGAIATLPLNIMVVGGDFSLTARQIFDSMLGRLKPELDSMGIKVTSLMIDWDATKGDSTANLVDQWFHASPSAEEFVVCISNFSGSLQDQDMFDDFLPNLQQILARLHNKKATLIWLEPESTKNAKKLIPKIINFLKKKIGWFTGPLGDPEFVSTNFKMKDPLTANIFDSGVKIQQFKRT